MRAPDADLARYLTELYAPMRDHRHRRARAHALVERRRDSGSVHLDATRVISTPAASIALQLPALGGEPAGDRRNAPTSVLVHASAAVFDGTAIVLPGSDGRREVDLGRVAGPRRASATSPTRWSRSTPRTGLIRPYPKYLSLGRALAHLRRRSRRHACARLSATRRLVPPDALRPGAVAPAGPPRLVVAPRYEPWRDHDASSRSGRPKPSRRSRSTRSTSTATVNARSTSSPRWSSSRRATRLVSGDVDRGDRGAARAHRRRPRRAAREPVGRVMSGPVRAPAAVVAS